MHFKGARWWQNLDARITAVDSTNHEEWRHAGAGCPASRFENVHRSCADAKDWMMMVINGSWEIIATYFVVLAHKSANFDVPFKLSRTEPKEVVFPAVDAEGQPHEFRVEVAWVPRCTACWWWMFHSSWRSPSLLVRYHKQNSM